jgi:hypothetical protein
MAGTIQRPSSQGSARETSQGSRRGREPAGRRYAPDGGVVIISDHGFLAERRLREEELRQSQDTRDSFLSGRFGS